MSEKKTTKPATATGTITLDGPKNISAITIDDVTYEVDAGVVEVEPRHVDRAASFGFFQE